MPIGINTYHEGISNTGSSISLNTSIDAVGEHEGDESIVMYSASFSFSLAFALSEFYSALLFLNDTDNLLLALLILSGVSLE